MNDFTRARLAANRAAASRRWTTRGAAGTNRWRAGTKRSARYFARDRSNASRYVRLIAISVSSCSSMR